VQRRSSDDRKSAGDSPPPSRDAAAAGALREGKSEDGRKEEGVGTGERRSVGRSVAHMAAATVSPGTGQPAWHAVQQCRNVDLNLTGDWESARRLACVRACVCNLFDAGAN